MTSWQNSKLTKWPSTNSLAKIYLKNIAVSQQNNKLMKQQVDKMTSWQSGKAMKQQVDKMTSQQSGKAIK